MVNVSTLFYVLENLEGKNVDLIDLDEISAMEERYLKGLLGIIDQSGVEVNPSLIKNILRSVHTE